MDEVQNQEEVKTEEITEQPAEGLMSNATLEKEETTQDEGMATKSADQVVEGEDLENVEFERPDYFPEKFWDKKDGPDVEGIAKGYTELEKAFHKKNSKAPESYDLKTLEEKGIDQSDPEVEFASGWAKANNISQESFDELVSKIAEIRGESIQEQEINEKEELAKLGENANEKIQSMVNWGRKLVSQGILNKDDFEEFKIMGGTAQGIRILNIFRGMTGEKEIPTMTMQVDGLDVDEVLSRVADPKYATDEAFRKQVEKDMIELEKSGKLSR
jgi:hypothetical protein|tara:strand:- start:7 stop:825 length:819 start_codon:yes stop_codon:yes gene_type:complete